MSIVYEGEKFTIQWYENEKGKSQPRDYFEQLSEKRQEKALALFSALADAGQLRDITKFRNEGNGVYAFKPQPDRFFSFFFKGGKIIITNAFEKKQNKLPKKEKQKALKAKEDWISRNPLKRRSNEKR